MLISASSYWVGTDAPGLKSYSGDSDVKEDAAFATFEACEVDLLESDQQKPLGRPILDIR